MKPAYIVLALVFGATACSSQSQYTPRAAQELTWAYDDELVVRDGDREIARGGGWTGLAEALACVPEAAAEAELADSRATSGAVLMWSSLGLFGASVGGGAALIVTEDNPWIGVSVLTGGALASLIPLLLGSNHESTARVHGVNAVNRFNDHADACAARVAAR